MSFHLLEAHWGSRPESLDECAARLVVLSDKLARLHQRLATWKPKSRANGAETGTLISMELAHKYLRPTKDNSAIPDSKLERMGFTFDLWDGKGISFSGLLGANEVTNSRSNQVRIKLPSPQSLEGAELYAPDMARSLIRALAESLDPDWAVLTTALIQQGQPNADFLPQVGWFTYLKSGPHRATAAPGNVLPVPNTDFPQGRLFSTGDSYESATVVAVQEFREMLVSAGLLTPMR